MASGKVHKFNIRLTDGVYEALADLAEETGLTIAELVRDGATQVLKEAALARNGQIPRIPSLMVLMRKQRND